MSENNEKEHFTLSAGEARRLTPKNVAELPEVSESTVRNTDSNIKKKIKNAI